MSGAALPSEVKVLAVASEMFPLVKTGGLADVVGALPASLGPEGVTMRPLLPGYPAVMAAAHAGASPLELAALPGGVGWIREGRVNGIDFYALDAPQLFDRPGNPYLGPNGTDWPDNALRFAALAHAAATIGRGGLAGFVPDILHVHDWQAGLVPAYLRYGGGPDGGRTRPPRTVMTVHNLAYQGQFPEALLPALGLPGESFTIAGVEYYGQIGFLKAGLQLADRITTVSPSYAGELLTSAGGMGLDGLFRARSGAVSGILNGIDTDLWNPVTDPHLAARYDARRLKARAANKAALQERLGLAPDPAALLFGVVSRLAWQKGLDLLLAALPTLLGEGAQLAVLGAGEAPIEAGYRAAAAAHPGRVACLIGFDEGLAHLFQAGADALLVPSRFEPCGLTQLSAQHYGAVPVVARVGGLADTVIDAGAMALAAGVATGLQFAPVTAEALEGAIRRTAALWREPAVWQKLQRNGMATDVSWRASARLYGKLFRDLLASGQPGADP